MGNCMRKNNQISAQDENEEGNKIEKIIKTTTSSSSSKLERAPREESMKKKKKKKKVRFNIQDGEGGRESDHGNSSDGVRRIRLVVTKEELKMILSYNKNDIQHTSLEQLLTDMKLRERRLYKVEKCDGGINSWRPGLESIPEDRSINEVVC